MGTVLEVLFIIALVPFFAVMLVVRGGAASPRLGRWLDRKLSALPRAHLRHKSGEHPREQ
jgi:hypothetical protein